MTTTHVPQVSMPQTPLAKRIANGGPATPSKSVLAARLATICRGEDAEMPVIGRVRIELVGETKRQEIEAQMYQRMAERGIELNVITAERFEAERAVRMLAAGVRDPDDPTKPLGTVEDWGGLDTGIINAAWQIYGDVRERLDPLAEPLTEDDRIAIESAVKKKAQDHLRSFGVSKLSAWLATTDVLPSSSPPPSSPTSESPSD